MCSVMLDGASIIPCLSLSSGKSVVSRAGGALAVRPHARRAADAVQDDLPAVAPRVPPRRGRGKGGIQNKNSTDVESPPPPPRVCMKYCIHPKGKSFPDLGRVGVFSMTLLRGAGGVGGVRRDVGGAARGRGRLVIQRDAPGGPGACQCRAERAGAGRLGRVVQSDPRFTPGSPQVDPRLTPG